jgi:hypothetical protein
MEGDWDEDYKGFLQERGDDFVKALNAHLIDLEKQLFGAALNAPEPQTT